MKNTQVKNSKKGTTMADNTAILAELTEIIKEATAGDLHDEVTVEKSFGDDLGVDSLTMVEIAVLAEQKLGVKIPDDELGNLQTVNDAVNYIAAKSP
jgi:acyl carrier protein